LQVSDDLDSNEIISSKRVSNTCDNHFVSSREPFPQFMIYFVFSAFFQIIHRLDFLLNDNFRKVSPIIMASARNAYEILLGTKETLA
jgi:hypothetical protein